MSAPDPKKWAPEPWEVSEVAMQSDSEFGDNDESGIVALCETVARRRALAELKEFWNAFKNEAANEDDNTIGISEAAIRIRHRIAAIEAEEA